ncbi:zinc finger CCCH domain-containing protein 47-like [Wolffia australiana]
MDDGRVLLELAAADDLGGFRRAVEECGLDPSQAHPWYGRWSNRMAVELRTPLMIAAVYGSAAVLDYLLTSGGAAALTLPSPSDGFTALRCAAAAAAAKPAKKEASSFPPDPTLPDINAGLYGTDEFRMFSFKVKPCPRAYSHDWTECPFVHPGENARRRDPRKFEYSCVPCPDFRKGSCRLGDGCEYAHGVFESWLHPAQYRTRLCKDEARCARRVCFFAHRPEELRARPKPGSEPDARPPRPVALAKRSQSFCDRGRPAPAAVGLAPSRLSGWGSPGGKVDWGVHGDELGRLRRSLSFADQGAVADEPDFSWVQSLVKDGPPASSPWFDQLYMEPQQIVA